MEDHLVFVLPKNFFDVIRVQWLHYLLNIETNVDFGPRVDNTF